MAKKKKSKLKKALLAGAALAGGLALAKRGKVPYRNVHETGAITQTPGRERWGPGVGGTQHYPKFQDYDFYAGHKKGGRIGAKKGGHVKSMGIAKRGGGSAKR